MGATKMKKISSLLLIISIVFYGCDDAYQREAKIVTNDVFMFCHYKFMESNDKFLKYALVNRDSAVFYSSKCRAYNEICGYILLKTKPVEK